MHFNSLSAAALAALAALAILPPLPAQAGLLDLLFGRSPGPARAPVFAPPPALDEPAAPRASRRTGAGGSSRAVCVRLCDGFYYPLGSVATRGGGGQSDCEQSCPGTAMDVFRVSGDAMADARDAAGRRYADLPAAFTYRTVLTPGCSCRRASGGPAIMGDMTLRSGDIVVTADGAVVFRGSDRDSHRPADFEDIRTSRALKGGAFALADRVLGFSFREDQARQDDRARKAAVQLAARPFGQDIVVTPLRTGSVSATARAEARQDAPPDTATPAGARVILPMPAALGN